MAEARLGQPRCLPGVSVARMVDFERRRGTIVSVVFGWVGLGIGELCKFELSGLGK